MLCSDEGAYREGIVFGGHSSFVSAVCILPPDEEHPNGLIVTGSNDHLIHVYTLESPEPVYRLTGHSDNGMHFACHLQKRFCCMFHLRFTVTP